MTIKFTKKRSFAIYFREGTKLVAENVGPDVGACAVCPWEMPETVEPTVSVSVCPWESEELPQSSDSK